MINPGLEPQYPIKRIKNVRIPLPDGISLSAELYLPDAPGKFPAVLNYIPYRKEDASAYTGMACSYFAMRGFAGVIVDIRGTGESQGSLPDEYTLQEQLDGCQVIDWLSHQPWCNGNVGMWGISYSGFNSIQIAMHAPPALKAIIPMCATDDRYNDDVHYYGGCLIGIEQVLYPAMMVAMNAVPPYPELSQGDWVETWMQRLEGDTPWILNWFRHQNEDDYWGPGSLKTDYAAIQCPVYSIGGWADGYTNPIFHMLENLQVPHKALIGPWLHSAPNSGIPGPNIDFLHEMCRWWAQWLAGEETGIMQEPQIAVYIQQGAAPTAYESFMPGKWRFLDHWPIEGLKEHCLYLSSDRRLMDIAGDENVLDIHRYQATIGTDAGVWCAVSGIDGITRDQSSDDGRSVTYTGPILDQAIEILGAPKAVLHVSSNAEVAFFCVKLEDVGPDGGSRLVARGVLNATHRMSHVHPEPLIPGEVVVLEIPLKYVSWTFQPGHRIRVAVSSSDFPWVWPSPQIAVNNILWGKNHPSNIILPVVKQVFSSPQEPFQNLPAPTSAANTGTSVFGESPAWGFVQDLVKGYTILQVSNGSRTALPGTGYTIESSTNAEFGASDDHPEATYAKGLCKYVLIFAERRTEITGRTALRSTLDNFFADIELTVKMDGEIFFNKKWAEEFSRNLL
jgi:uncharacterized protein